MATISDVAKKAGVSQATVSRVIQGAKNVKPATREKVQRAIEELGYVPSAVAQSLRSKRTRSLALVVPDVTNSFWTTVARGVEDAAQRNDYAVLLCNTDENPAKQQYYVDFLLSQRVDGVIIAPYGSDAQHLGKLRKRDVPTVVIDRRIEGWDVDSVRTDSVSGARALVQHLISLGHTRVAMMSGPENTSTAEDRVAGYCMALAEVGIPVDSPLIKRGEFRTESGEQMTHEVLEDGLNPTAIFAANNAIAMGVVFALEKHGLRVPQDIALVCFDEVRDISHLFPFLTVVSQPAYDMGVNAAQLLLSRLNSEASLQPRHVVLPTRLIIRHSCGTRLHDRSDVILSLPLPKSARVETSVLVKPLSPEEGRDFSHLIAGSDQYASRREERLSDYDRSDVQRLLKALQHQETDRVSHLELWVKSKEVYEYVLERELKYEVTGVKANEQSIAAEDRVEFAQRLGMDAVICDFSWRPKNIIEPDSAGVVHTANGAMKTHADLDDLAPPPSLANQLSDLERYLRAVRGTGVGVIAGFSSFFDTALLAARVDRAPRLIYDQRPFLEKLMDVFLGHQEKVMRAVCDRFADDLALILVSDDAACDAGLKMHLDMFVDIFVHRMKRLIAPAKEHGKLLLLHSNGKMDEVLPILHGIGFDAIHPVEPETNDIFALKRRWAGKMALVGNFPTSLLVNGNKHTIEATVRDYCVNLAPDSGFVLSSSNGITDDVLPENLMALTRAVHKYGRYGSLGQESR